MNDLILDRTIDSARPLDFWPTQKKGNDACPACFDLHLEPGVLALTHAAMSDWVLITPTRVRIVLPSLVNMDQLHKKLAVGGALRNVLVDLRCAAIIDRGILAACNAVKNELKTISDQASGPGTGADVVLSDDPIFQPYDRFWYAVDGNGDHEFPGNLGVLAIPIWHVNHARMRDPGLVIDEMDDLPNGLSPVLARIGVPESSADYAKARSEWIEIALESLVANIEEAIQGWPVMPGEPFQNVVRLDDDLFFITLDTVDGVTVASSSASKQSLEQFRLDVHNVGRSHLAHGLAMLRGAVVR